MPTPTTFVLLPTGFAQENPTLGWTALDVRGVECGHYDFGGACRATDFLNDYGLHGPYTVAPVDPDRPRFFAPRQAVA